MFGSEKTEKLDIRDAKLWQAYLGAHNQKLQDVVARLDPNTPIIEVINTLVATQAAPEVITAALRIAVVQEDPNIEVINHLVDAGADPFVTYYDRPLGSALSLALTPVAGQEIIPAIIKKFLTKIPRNDAGRLKAINAALQTVVARENPNIDIINDFLAAGANPFVVCDDKYLSLNLYKPSSDSALALVSAKDKKIALPIIKAFLANPIIKAFLAKKTESDTNSSEAINAALRSAVDKNFPDTTIIGILLNAGANPFDVCSNRHPFCSALALVSDKDEKIALPIIQEFLVNTAENYANRSEAVNEALQRAVNKDFPDLDVIKALLRAGANPFVVYNGKYLLGSSLALVLAKDEKIALPIIQEFLVKTAKNYANRSEAINEALRRVSCQEDPDLRVINALLGASPDPKAITEALYEVVGQEKLNIEVINILVDAGADPFDVFSRSLFDCALILVLQKEQSTAPLIIRKFLTKQPQNCPGKLEAITVALRIAVAQEAPSIEIINALLGASPTPEAITAALRSAVTKKAQSIEVINALLDAGANPANLSAQILEIVIVCNNKECLLKILKQIKTCPNILENLTKALREVISKESPNIDIINALLEAGADPYASGYEKKSALTLALAHTDEKISRDIVLKMLNGSSYVNRSAELTKAMQLAGNKVQTLEVTFALINALDNVAISSVPTTDTKHESLDMSKEADIQTGKIKQTNLHAPFSSKPYADNSKQSEVDNMEAQKQTEELYVDNSKQFEVDYTEAQKQTEELKEIEERKKENETQIMAKSFLSNFITSAKNPLLDFYAFKLNYKDAKKLLALVNMDMRAKNSGYEAFDQYLAAAWSLTVLNLVADSDFANTFKLFTKSMKKYTNAISAVKTLTESADEIRNLIGVGTCSDVDQYANKIKGKLLQLETKESYIMAGGWAEDHDGHDGHAMAYRFQKTEQGNFDIYIYNAHSATDQGGEYRIEGRTKSRPCFCFKNVTPGELFFVDPNGATEAQKSGSSITLKCLIEFRYSPVLERNEKARSVDDILSLFSRFGEKLTPTARLPRLFLSVQHSGDCSFKNINCLLLEIMNGGEMEEQGIKESTKDYKRLMLDARLLSLLAFYHKFKNNFGQPDYLQCSIMLESAARGYLGKLRWNQCRGIISQEEHDQALATCHDLLAELQQKTNKARAAVKTDEEVEHRIDSLLINDQGEKRQKKITQLAELKQPQQQVDADFSLNIELGNISSWRELSNELTKLKNILDQAVKNSCYQSVVSQFEIAIGKLFANLNNTVPDNILTKEDKSQAILDECLDIYIKSVGKIDGYSSPRAQNTGMAAMALSYLLAASKDPAVFGKYGLYIEYFQDMASSGTAIFSPHDDNVPTQRKELLNFYERINTGKEDNQLFDFKNIRIHEDTIAKNKIPEARLYANLKDKQEASLHHSKDALFHSIDNYPDSMKHIGYLKRAALSAFALFLPERKNDLDGNSVKTLLNGKVEYRYSNRAWITQTECISYSELAVGDYPIDFNAYGNNVQHTHEDKTIKLENDLLVSAGQEVVDETDSALSEPLVPSLLIKLIDDNLLQLNDSSWRVKIEALFFKTYQLNGVTVSPIYQQIKRDNALICKMDDLIGHCYEKCIDGYGSLFSNQKWEVMLFVIRLRSNLLFAKKLAGSPINVSSKKCNARMLDWLDKSEKDITDKLKSEVTLPNEDKSKLEKILCELKITHSGLLLAIPPKDLSLEQRAQLFSNMMEINSKIEVFSKLECRAFLRECQHRFVTCQNDWQDLRSPSKEPKKYKESQESKELNAFCNSLIEKPRKELQLPAPNEQWQSKNGQLCNGQWVIDLTRPMIMYNKQALGKKLYEVTPAFIRLFADLKFEVMQVGENVITFKDPVWGRIDIVGKGDDSKIYRYIKIEDSETDEKFLYIHPDNSTKFKEDLLVNNALCWDHVFWVRVPTEQETQQKMQVTPELRIYDLHDGSKCLFKTKNNKLVDSAKALVFCLPPADYSEALERFDDLGQIGTWAVEGENQLSHVEFPRYVQDSSLKEPLKFTWNDVTDAWIYDKDPQYQLSKKSFGPFISTNQRYLHLVKIGEEAKHKVLIPVGELLAAGFEQYYQVYTGNGDKDGNKASQIYFEYECDENGQITPPRNNLAACVYLAHIYLAQKRYQEAKDVLKLISMSDNPSEQAIKLVKELLFSELALHDQSPDACAIRLYAYAMFKKINPHIKGLGGIYNKKTSRTISDVYQDYLGGLEQTERPLWLTDVEELQLLELPEMNGKKLELRRAYLQNKQDSNRIITVCDSDKVRMISFDAMKFVQEYRAPSEITIKENDYKTFKDLYNKLLQARSTELEMMIYQFLTEKKRHFHSYKDPHVTQVLLYVAGHQQDFTGHELPDTNNGFKEWWKKKIRGETKRNASEDVLYVPVYPIPETETVDSSRPMQEALPWVDEEQWTNQFSPPFVHNIDQEFAGWQRSFLSQTLSSALGSELKPSAAILPDDEVAKRLYTEVVNTERNRYIKDCEDAKAQEATKCVVSEASLEKLLQQLEKTFPCRENGEIVAQEREQLLYKFVLDYANKLPTDIQQYCEQLASKEANRIPSVEFDKIMRAAATSLTALKRLNPNLSKEEVIKWRVACLDYMALVTHRRQVNLIYKPLKKLVDATTNSKADIDLQWKNEVVEALSQGRTYNPYDPNQKDYFPLMFEYFSGLRVRPIQAKIIKDVLDTIINKKSEGLKNKIFQLIMAGGKTSVIISIILEIAAQNKQLPIVLCHSSQYASVLGNLRNFQESRYGKDLCALEYSIQELGDEEVLNVIIKKINTAKAEGNTIIMKSFMPQVIELKYILEAKRLAECNKPSIGKKIWTLVQKLAQINNAFIEHGMGVLDECDSILSMLAEVNVPIGDEKTLLPERSELVKAIYLSLATNEQIKDKVKLIDNKQSELSAKEYPEIVAVVAGDLWDNADDLLHLKGKPEHEAAFIRYIKGEILPEHQNLADSKSSDDLGAKTDPIIQENVAFLRYLAELSTSDKQAADSIAITARIIKDVLPLALSKSCDRAYGRNQDPAKDDGSVIPYLGVGTPATTRFGYVYLALCYQMQTALNSGISEGGLRFLAEKMDAAAISFASMEVVAYDKTDEAQWFWQHTGQKLSKVLENEASLKAACTFINDREHPERRLAIEAEAAPLHVKYYQDYVCSNPINLTEQMCNDVCCSGTPNNWRSYNHKLGELQVENGAEGKVINEILRRAKDKGEANSERYVGYKALRPIKNGNLDTILQQILEHPTKPNKLRCLIDAGGFLKGIDNKKVATDILATFAKLAKNTGDRNPCVDAVIYLQRSKNEKGIISESFVLLRRKPGEDKLEEILLPNTFPDTIKKYMPDLNKLFVFYDELRTTGTDIAMAPGIIGLETVDPRMPIRTLLQATIRERSYFRQNSPQDCEFLVTEEGQSKMQNQGKTLPDVVSTLISNQAIAISDQVFSHYLASITNVVRDYVLKLMLNKETQSDFKDAASRYQNLLINSFNDEPYEQFGRIKGPQDTLKILEQHAVKTIGAFFKANNMGLSQQCIKSALDSGDMQLSTESSEKNYKALDIVNSIRKILQEAKKDCDENILSKQLIYRSEDRVDTEVQIDQEQMVEVELAQEQEVALRQELQRELALYNFIPAAESFKVEKWQLNEHDNFDLPGYLAAKKMIQVKDVCNMAYYNKDSLVNTERFANCFPSNLYMSENLRMAFEGVDLPLLHKGMKPANFMLVTKNALGRLEFLLLSKHEAPEFSDWICQVGPANAWFLDLNGSEEVTNTSHPITELTDNQQSRSELTIALWYANFFNGDAVYLEKNKELSQQIMTIDKRTVMSDYMLMRPCYNNRLQQAARASKLLRPSREVLKKKTVLFSARRKKLENDIKIVQVQDAEYVAALTNADEIIKLQPSQFKWLRTPEQIKILAYSLLDNEMLGQYLECFKPEQIQYFNSAHLDALSDAQISKLTDAATIAKLSAKRLNEIEEASDYKNLLKLLTKEQLARLTNRRLISQLDSEQLSQLSLYTATKNGQCAVDARLLEVVMEPQVNFKVIGTLLDAEANPFISSDSHQSALACVLTRTDKQVAKEIMLTLLEKTKYCAGRAKELDKVLIAAINEEKPNIDTIDTLLSAGADPFVLSRADRSDSVLTQVLACEDKNLALNIIQKLLEKTRSCAGRSKELNKAMITAIKKNNPDTDIINTLLRAGADLEELNKALIAAMNEEKPDMVLINALIKHGANPNIRNKNNHPPLIIAIQEKNAHIFTEIINDVRVNCLVLTKAGNTPLMLARKYFEENVDIVKNIETDSRFDHNEKKGTLDQGKISERMRIYLRLNKKDDAFIENFTKNCCAGIVRLYLYCSVSKKDHDWFFNTTRLISTFDEKAPLTKKEKACFDAFISKIEYFQKSDAGSISEIDQDSVLNDLQCTPTEKLIRNKTMSLEQLKVYLRDQDAIPGDKYIHIVANNCMTALIKKNGCYTFFDPSNEYGEKVITSIDALASILFTSDSGYKGMCSFKLTIHSFELKETKNLEPAKVNSEIKDNAKKMSLEQPEQAIKCGDLDGVGKGVMSSATTAVLAAEKGNIEAFKTMLHDKQDMPGQYGETAFHVAVRCKRLDIIEMLLKTDIDPNVAAGHGMTAVMWAVKYANDAKNAADKGMFTKIVEALQNNLKVDLNIRDDKDNTAFMLANSSNNKEIVKMLLGNPRVNTIYQHVSTIDGNIEEIKHTSILNKVREYLIACDYQANERAIYSFTSSDKRDVYLISIDTQEELPDFKERKEYELPVLVKKGNEIHVYGRKKGGACGYEKLNRGDWDKICFPPVGAPIQKITSEDMTEEQQGYFRLSKDHHNVVTGCCRGISSTCLSAMGLQVQPNPNNVERDDYLWFKSTLEILMNWDKDIPLHGFNRILIDTGETRPQNIDKNTIVVQKHDDTINVYWGKNGQKSLSGQNAQEIFAKIKDIEECSSDRELVEFIETKCECIPLSKEKIANIERLIGQFEFFQHTYLYFSGKTQQADLDNAITCDYHGDKGINAQKEYEIKETTVSQTELEDLLKTENFIQENKLVSISCPRHNTVLIKQNGYYYYFDTNYNYVYRKAITIKELAKMIFEANNFEYKDLASLKLALTFRVFAFKTKYSNWDKFIMSISDKIKIPTILEKERSAYLQRMLDVAAEQKKAGMGLLLKESELKYFMDACGKIQTEYNDVFAAIISITRDPGYILHLIQQDVENYAFENLRNLNKINPAAFIALLTYGCNTSSEIQDAQLKAKLIAEILTTEALFDPSNETVPGVGDILKIISSVAIQEKKMFFLKDLLYDYKKFTLALSKVFEKYPGSNLIAELKNNVESYIKNSTPIPLSEQHVSGASGDILEVRRFR